MNACGAGRAQHRPQHRRKHVRVLVRVNMREAHAAVLQQRNLGRGFSFDLRPRGCGR